MPSVHDSVKKLSGVGEKRAEAFAKIGIHTVADLLYHFPRGYQNRGCTVSLAEAGMRGEEGLPSSVMLTIAENARSSRIRGRMTLVKVRGVETDFPESTATAELTFFNQTYLSDRLRTGQNIRVWGKFKKEGRRYTVTSPILEFYTERKALIPITPVYPLTAGITQNYIAKLVSEALTCPDIGDCEIIPSRIRDASGICSVADAFRGIHLPKSPADAETSRRRFAFERIFVTAAALASTGSRRPDSGAVNMGFVPLDTFLGELPFTLTGCQARAVDDIARDLASVRPMKRMISGDVGSGKTAVAAAAAYICAVAGYTCAMMVPTEILANQHYADMAPLFANLGMSVALLTGSTPKKERTRILAGLCGEGDRIDFVIGTHALLSDGVDFANLGLVITDEQHRFGVMQRAALENKAGYVHTLVMSATPIPRTLTLVMYGDLDVSILDELPPGRIPVSTFAVDESYRNRLNGFIKKQAEEGHRTYVVCPAVEEKPSENPEEMADLFCDNENTLPLKAAVDFAKELAEALPELRIGFVHGKMKNTDRDKVMGAFAAGELDVLVSTTVIEVGVNVPAATLMVVENAERFGLSQLHQLRGRVGRGNAKSYCILVSDSKSPRAKERLDTMCKNRSGFRIAEEDLRQRGPGDFFAVGGVIKQSGAGGSVYSAVTADPTLIDAASSAAKEIVLSDPRFSSPELQKLGEKVRLLTGEYENIIN